MPILDIKPSKLQIERLKADNVSLPKLTKKEERLWNKLRRVLEDNYDDCLESMICTAFDDADDKVDQILGFYMMLMNLGFKNYQQFIDLGFGVPSLVIKRAQVLYDIFERSEKIRKPRLNYKDIAALDVWYEKLKAWELENCRDFVEGIGGISDRVLGGGVIPVTQDQAEELLRVLKGMSKKREEEDTNDNDF